MRWWSRLAFIAGMGLTTMVACSSDRANHGGEEQRAGTLTLPLRTVSNTGSVYFLRNAFFLVRSLDTGETQFISTEDGLPERSEIVLRLASGSYEVTLFDGWFLERFSGSGGGSGGSTGAAGSSSMGGKGGFPFGGAPAEDVPAHAVPPPESAGAAGEPASSGGSSSMGGSGPVGGEGPEGGSGGGTTNGEIVQNARLVSDPTQFVFISPQSDEFVNFSFRVGDDVIEFKKGNLHITFDVDDQPLCVPPPDVTHKERVLLESNESALKGVSLRQVFDALATNGGRKGDGQTLYRQIFDSYATAQEGVLPNAAHCGDETTNGDTTLNGYHIDCNRVERFHVDDMDSFFPTAFVNRLDLAPANGAHCGQQRMIFASNSQGRAFMIVEAQIPNPSPELGIEGCRPLAQFWLDQNDISDPLVRGQRLLQAFLVGGAPGLENFGPFYTAENLTVGSGQIRTNQFDQDPWTLREFKLALDESGGLTAVPFPVAESPNGALWDENSKLPQGAACRKNFLEALDGVLTDDMSQMSFVVDSACKDAESRNDFTEDYANQMSDSPDFAAQIENKLRSVGSKLSAQDVANRARFSGSCIGCHNESQFSSLGNGVFAPASFDFPQVTEGRETCGDGGGSCFSTSVALKTVFLPGRLQALGSLVPVVPDPCVAGGGGSGQGGTSGSGGSIGIGGSVNTGGSMPIGKNNQKGMASVEAAPVIEIELPPADEPVEQMQEEEQEIRQEYGDVTISGKSAQSTH
jgi:hypothetical protein